MSIFWKAGYIIHFSPNKQSYNQRLDLKDSYCKIYKYFALLLFISPVVRQLADRSLYNGFMTFFVYVAHNSVFNKIYIGQTNDLDKRIMEHNEKFGNHYTSKFSGNWKLIYKEEFKTRQEAIKREKQLKSYKGREFVKQFIPL